MEILNGLCDWRLDCDDVPDHIKVLSSYSVNNCMELIGPSEIT